uniref:TACC_C domain-containing protein n=1 Tax=Parastrongyloides trichosuri TaxID=131310 RepID=A0A0N4ZFQ4_PARTI
MASKRLYEPEFIPEEGNVENQLTPRSIALPKKRSNNCNTPRRTLVTPNTSSENEVRGECSFAESPSGNLFAENSDNDESFDGKSEVNKSGLFSAVGSESEQEGGLFSTIKELHEDTIQDVTNNDVFLMTKESVVQVTDNVITTDTSVHVELKMVKDSGTVDAILNKHTVNQEILNTNGLNSTGDSAHFNNSKQFILFGHDLDKSASNVISQENKDMSISESSGTENNTSNIAQETNETTYSNNVTREAVTPVYNTPNRISHLISKYENQLIEKAPTVEENLNKSQSTSDFVLSSQMDSDDKDSSQVVGDVSHITTSAVFKNSFNESADMTSKIISETINLDSNFTGTHEDNKNSGADMTNESSIQNTNATQSFVTEEVNASILPTASQLFSSEETNEIKDESAIELFATQKPSQEEDDEQMEKSTLTAIIASESIVQEESFDKSALTEPPLAQPSSQEVMDEPMDKSTFTAILASESVIHEESLNKSALAESLLTQQLSQEAVEEPNDGSTFVESLVSQPIVYEESSQPLDKSTFAESLPSESFSKDNIDSSNNVHMDESLNKYSFVKPNIFAASTSIIFNSNDFHSVANTKEVIQEDSTNMCFSTQNVFRNDFNKIKDSNESISCTQNDLNADKMEGSISHNTNVSFNIEKDESQQNETEVIVPSKETVQVAEDVILDKMEIAEDDTSKDSKGDVNEHCGPVEEPTKECEYLSNKMTLDSEECKEKANLSGIEFQELSKLCVGLQDKVDYYCKLHMDSVIENKDLVNNINDMQKLFKEQICTIREENFELKNDCANFKNENEKLSYLVTKLDEEKVSIQKAFDELQCDYVKIKEELIGLKAVNDTLSKDVLDKKFLLEEFSAADEEFKLKIEAKDHDLKKMESNIKDLEGKNQEYEKNKIELLCDMKRLISQEEELISRNENLLTHNAKLLGDVEAKNQLLEMKDLMIRKLEKDLENEQAENTKTIERLTIKEDELIARNNELTDLNNQMAKDLLSFKDQFQIMNQNATEFHTEQKELATKVSDNVMDKVGKSLNDHNTLINDSLERSLKSFVAELKSDYARLEDTFSLKIQEKNSSMDEIMKLNLNLNNTIERLGKEISEEKLHLSQMNVKLQSTMEVIVNSLVRFAENVPAKEAFAELFDIIPSIKEVIEKIEEKKNVCSTNDSELEKKLAMLIEEKNKSDKKLKKLESQVSRMEKLLDEADAKEKDLKDGLISCKSKILEYEVKLGMINADDAFRQMSHPDFTKEYFQKFEASSNV